MSLKPQQVCEYGCTARTFRRTYTIPARVEAIAPVVDEVTLIAEELGRDKSLDVALALQEALANAVIHGCKSDPTLTVDCWVACDPGPGILIIVRDPGAGFDHDSPPNPLDKESLHATNGRGVYLIRELMDDVHFLRNGAEVHMSKR